MREKLTVIKVGGKIVEEEATLRQLLNDFAAIDGHKVLVHGGGRSATKIAAQLGIESKMVNGRRIILIYLRSQKKFPFEHFHF